MMKQKWKRVLSFLILLVIPCGILIQACSRLPAAARTQGKPAAHTPETGPEPTFTGGFSDELKIAILIPITGLVSAFGLSTLDGVQMAIDEWNGAGGVLGKKIVPIVEDSQCGSELAVNAAKKVIEQDQVHYIVGDVCSSAAIPISEIAETRGVVQISPASTHEELTLKAIGGAKKYVYRACYTDSFQGFAAGQFARDTLKLKRAFILDNETNSYTTRLANSFEQTFTASGGQIVGRENYTTLDMDFSVTFSRIVRADSEIIFLGDAYPIVNHIVEKARQKDITIPFIGADGWESPDLDRNVVDGSYYSTHFSPQDQRPVVQEWVEKYRAEYGSIPDALAALGYDAANILLASIVEAGVDDPSLVAKAMASLRWEGVTGTIQFDEKHNPIKPVVIMQVKDGQIHYVTTVFPEDR